MEQKKISLRDGLFKQNIVFMSGLLVAPVIACANTLMKSLAVCIVFSLVSFLTILVCRAVPRKIAYTLRVIIYCLVASLIYIPVMLFTRSLFGEQLVASAGVYLPILVTNSLILSKTESRFYGEPINDMIIDSAVFILGFDISCIFIGSMRELIANSTLGGLYIPMPFTVPALETTFGGFLTVGVFAGLFRGIYNRRKAKLLEPEEDSEEESLAEYAEDMGEFLTGRKRSEPETIKIYKSPKKKRRKQPDTEENPPENLMDMTFRDNTDVLAEFEAIVSGASETAEQPSDEPADTEKEELNE